MKLTKEQIANTVREFWLSDDETKEREMTLYQGCLKRGFIKVGSGHCGDKNCENCNNFYELVNEEIKKQCK